MSESFTQFIVGSGPDFVSAMKKMHEMLDGFSHLNWTLKTFTTHTEVKVHPMNPNSAAVTVFAIAGISMGADAAPALIAPAG